MLSSDGVACCHCKVLPPLQPYRYQVIDASWIGLSSDWQMGSALLDTDRYNHCPTNSAAGFFSVVLSFYISISQLASASTFPGIFS